MTIELVIFLAWVALAALPFILPLWLRNENDIIQARQRTNPNTIRTECSYCGHHIGGDPRAGQTSHGICLPCGHEMQHELRSGGDGSRIIATKAPMKAKRQHRIGIRWRVGLGRHLRLYGNSRGMLAVGLSTNLFGHHARKWG